MGAVFASLAEQRIEFAESTFEFKPEFHHVANVMSDQGHTTWSGSQFCCDMLVTLLKLRSDAVNPFEASWFWYDSDSASEDPHDLYHFFVVHDRKIVRERCTFSDHHDNGFDPTVWTEDQESESVWLSDKGVRDARIRYWYRTFYRNTVTGQLMVLRSDEPELFHYPEGQFVRLLYGPSDSGGDEQAKMLRALLASLVADK